MNGSKSIGNIDNITVKRIRNFSFHEAYEYVDQLNKKISEFRRLKLDDIPLYFFENIDTYLQNLYIIEEKYFNSEYDSDIEVLEVYKFRADLFRCTSFLEHLGMQYGFKNLLTERAKRWNNEIKKMESLISTVESNANENVEQINNFYEKTLNDIKIAKDDLDTAKDDLKDEEHRILTHVLALLGFFTALVTIILSTVSATTSWLNKSDSADFGFAILVPSAIIIISMIAMFTLLYLLIFRKYDAKNEQDENESKSENVVRKKDFRVHISILILAIICFVLLSFMIINSCLNKEKKEPISEEKEEHIILHITDYRLDLEANKIIYTFDGNELSMECNMDLVHSDGLHYCVEHKTFE